MDLKGSKLLNQHRRHHDVIVTCSSPLVGVGNVTLPAGDEVTVLRTLWRWYKKPIIRVKVSTMMLRTFGRVADKKVLKES